MNYLKKVISDIESGKAELQEHELIEDWLPFPGKDEEERAIGYIPVKQEKHEEKYDKPIKVARKGR